MCFKCDNCPYQVPAGKPSNRRIVERHKGGRNDGQIKREMRLCEPCALAFDNGIPIGVIASQRAKQFAPVTKEQFRPMNGVRKAARAAVEKVQEVAEAVILGMTPQPIRKRIVK